MATAKTTTSALLTELNAFATNIGNLDYDKLLPTAAEAGWGYRLVEKSILFTPQGHTLVTFDVQVGKDGTFEFFDTISITVPGGAGPTSLVARVQSTQTLIYLFFGRLPPQVAAPAQPAAQTIRTDDVDIVLPDVEEQQEYVNKPLPPIEVVARHEPDGVPIFVDLYALGDPSAEVITAVLDAVDDFLERAQSVETINAMGTKNPMMIKFIKDLGTPEDSAALMDMITRRRNLVAPPVLSNARRRSAATAN
jgi:hypothetical protein